MQILVAEDEPLVLKAVEFRLRKDGYDVITCTNGLDAWESIEKHRPDLIISDILMPFFSGLEIVGRLKNSPFHEIPIIILSSLCHENVVVDAFRLGADDFISKPFGFSELSIRVDRLITAKRYSSSLLAV